MKDNFNPEEVFAAIRTILPGDRGFISLHEPSFKGNEWKYIKNCLDTGWVSSVGAYVNQLEKDLVDYTGAKYAVAVVNGTAALHIALQLAGVQAGEEVIVPSLTFIATVNAISYCGAIPHFADSEEKSLGLAPAKLHYYLDDICEMRGQACFDKYTGRRIRAVLPMHTFGHPVDMDPLLELSQKFNLQLVEDAAESLGSFYKGHHTGTMGMLATLSFNGNKTITTGGGGAILTNDESIARLAKHITTQAKLPHKWGFNHDMVGYNYRMPNINAALGCAQLEQLPGFIERKRNLARQYKEAFENVSWIRFFSEPEYARSNYWLNVLVLDRAFAYERDHLLELTNNAGIMTRPLWTPMHKLNMYQNCPRMDLSTAEDLERRIINIPSSAFWGE